MVHLLGDMLQAFLLAGGSDIRKGIGKELSDGAYGWMILGIGYPSIFRMYCCLLMWSIEMLLRVAEM